MAATGGGRLATRLNRILLMLPYAIRNPGMTLDELARHFGVKRSDLADDLHLLFMCGLPGYGPGDLIDVDVQDDRVYIRMADYFRAPLRLTPAEGLALLAGGEAIAALPGMEEADALRRALQKLRAALGGAAADDAVDVRLDRSPEQHMRTLQDALDENVRVHLEYMSASRGELSSRDVDPWGLIAATGHWYLVGLDHLSGEERMFRIDRIKAVEKLVEAVDVPDDFDPERYKGAFIGDAESVTVTFEISPGAARWFGEYYPVASSETQRDGWVRVGLPASGDRWVATLLLRLGDDVRKVEPQTYADAARDLAARIAARYG